MDAAKYTSGRLDLPEGAELVASLGLREEVGVLPVRAHGEGAQRPAALVETRDRVHSRVVDVYRGYEIRKINEHALYCYRIRRLGRDRDVHGAYYASVYEARDDIVRRVESLIDRTQAIYGVPAECC